MKDRLFALIAYLNYWLQKEDEYSLQGPFLSDLYSELRQYLKISNQSDLEIEGFRNSLLKNPEKIQVLDLGAGSKKVNTQQRKISDITAYSTSGKKFCKLYQYFCSLTPAKHIIELGTCMGISTRYLASAAKGMVYTFEGSEEIQKTAKQNSSNYPIEFIGGEIKTTLPKVLRKIPSVDFALIDANHTYEGTIRSFDLILNKIHSQSIIAIADIHWSKGMTKAWTEIKNRPEVKLSLDFYEAGILFFEVPFTKPRHLVLSI
ncbi:O-methyltransferase [Algoriphagus sediminis]|uniref:Class I SAM-dependent methyltransferase n=1 Tax=Algoriphagus sediminis TaxID=3057113 RepID=A0ABT7YGT1_9BACT|nr:class I SAM-dependent methyltransferase [Algoriphagus sediminis]MDN3205749.1 class I SAM-dependent methyltransferase [Algoriphagus sediminis]